MSTQKYIVTGASGFVGKAIAKAILDKGSKVLALSRRGCADLLDRGAEELRVDLSVMPSTHWEFFAGAAGAFHVAAKVDMWGVYQEFYQNNVVATQNVINACQKYGVKNLVFTSSPSVVAGKGDLCAANEDVPYPKYYSAYYPQTKAMAEKLVMSANSVQLKTAVLRPHLVFGPGDTNLIPTIIAKAKAGQLIQVGDGTNLTDLCFIDDCVQAHLLAMQRLEEEANVAGKVYFISQGEAVNMWQWINEVLRLSGLPVIKRHIPKSIALTIAYLAELLSTLGITKGEPRLTSFLVHEMATSHYFDISRAKRDLGFKPRYSIKEALERTFVVGA